MIREREVEIQEIETGIHELSEIFRDLGTLVNQQGGMLGMLCPWHVYFALLNFVEIIDNIESNIYSIASDTRGAAEELSTASEHQRKAGRRAACLMLIIVFVVAIVLIAVSPCEFMHLTGLLNLLVCSQILLP